MPFTFVDLFCGIGGFHAALAPTGGRLALASDIDPKASQVYARNWLTHTGVSVQSDIRELTKDRCKSVPEHDVLTAGFPCQPFSKSGQQLGVAEERGQLFYSILKVLQYRRPKLVILENVRNLVGPRHRQDYERIVTLMRGLGYAVSGQPLILSPHWLPLEFGGTPQHRERLFIVGIHVGRRSARVTVLPHLEEAKSAAQSRNEHDWDLRTFLLPTRPSSSHRKSLQLRGEADEAIDAWEAFVQAFISANGEAALPGFPIWTDVWRARAKVRIPRDTPHWKRELILKNVAFYESNCYWIDRWAKRVDLFSFSPSLRKFEWQAGNPRSLSTCLIQLRPSGVRVKRPNYTPALVAIGQTPILGWERRELSIPEAAALQGFHPTMDFSSQNRVDSIRQLGNAVNVGVARHVFGAAIQDALQLGLEWSKSIDAVPQAGGSG